MSEMKYREFWICEPRSGLQGHSITNVSCSSQWDKEVHVIEYSAIEVKEAEIEQLKKEYRYLEQGLLKISAENEAYHNEIERLKEVISYLPKVPTQPYEKELVQEIMRLKAENEKWNWLDSWIDDEQKIEIASLRLKYEAAHSLSLSLKAELAEAKKQIYELQMESRPVKYKGEG